MATCIRHKGDREMKKNMKILLIVCLVLGVALMALWGYVQLNADAIADISARVDAYKQAQAQVEAARVLGQRWTRRCLNRPKPWS